MCYSEVCWKYYAVEVRHRFHIEVIVTVLTL